MSVVFLGLSLALCDYDGDESVIKVPRDRGTFKGIVLRKICYIYVICYVLKTIYTIFKINVGKILNPDLTVITKLRP